MTNLQARILITILYFPALLLSVFDEKIFSLVTFALLALGWYEYLSFKLSPKTSRDWTGIAGLILLGALPALVHGLGRPTVMGLGVLALAFQIYVIRSMINRKSFDEMKGELSFYLTGFLYLTLLFTLWIAIRERPSGREAIWFLLFVVGASDSVAYFVGRAFGRKPFFQHISPKKTVEGFWGGMLGSLLMGLGFYFLFHKLEYQIPPLATCLLLSLAVGLAGVFGDLFESMIKRHYGVKDSGRIMGGHGGVLDRFDAALFGAVPLFFYVAIFGGFQ